MTDYSSLFLPVAAGNIDLTNRIVMAPMTRFRTDDEHSPLPMVAQYYTQRASAGLIITESMAVVPCGYGYPPIPGIWAERQIQSWRDVVTKVHSAEGKIVAQLSHVIRAKKSNDTEKSGWWALENAVKPSDLSLDELKQISQDFASGAIRALEAGFDGVEIHNANGYFFDRMLRSSTNSRRDSYGGSVENRSRLTLEIIEAVVGAVGSDKVGIRLSPNSIYEEASELENREVYSYLLSKLSDLNLAYLHITRPEKEMIEKQGKAFVDFIDIRKMYAGTIIANGQFSGPEAAKLVSTKVVDAISFARLFIANPDLVQRIFHNFPLAKENKSTIYTHDEIGYTDYGNYGTLS